jgi:tRNA A37 threonylcarbamoyladenosine synthetase subunit TsaC/SUA5/YrdC
MLGERVEVILDGGPTRGSQASSIVDCTARGPRLLREGALSLDTLREFLAGQDQELEDLTSGA